MQSFMNLNHRPYKLFAFFSLLWLFSIWIIYLFFFNTNLTFDQFDRWCTEHCHFDFNSTWIFKNKRFSFYDGKCKRLACFVCMRVCMCKLKNSPSELFSTTARSNALLRTKNHALDRNCRNKYVRFALSLGCGNDQCVVCTADDAWWNESHEYEQSADKNISIFVGGSKPR